MPMTVLMLVTFIARFGRMNSQVLPQELFADLRR